MPNDHGVIELAEDLKPMELHPHADMILILRRDSTEPARKCLAHSEVLVAVSPYFTILLGPHFCEGRALCSEQQLEITLKEDNPEVMDVLLLVIHHKTSGHQNEVDLQLLARISRASDKYCCNGVLSPGGFWWLQESRHPGSH